MSLTHQIPVYSSFNTYFSSTPEAAANSRRPQIFVCHQHDLCLWSGEVPPGKDQQFLHSRATIWWSLHLPSLPLSLYTSSMRWCQILTSCQRPTSPVMWCAWCMISTIHALLNTVPKPTRYISDAGVGGLTAASLCNDCFNLDVFGSNTSWTAKSRVWWLQPSRTCTKYGSTTAFRRWNSATNTSSTHLNHSRVTPATSSAKKSTPDSPPWLCIREYSSSLSLSFNFLNAFLKVQKSMFLCCGSSISVRKELFYFLFRL